MTDVSESTARARLFGTQTPHSAHGATGANICHALDRITLYDYPGLSLEYITEVLAGEKRDIPEFTWRGWTIRLQNTDGVTVARDDVVHHEVNFVANCTVPGSATADDVYSMLRLQTRLPIGYGRYGRPTVLKKTPGLYEAIDREIQFEAPPAA